MTPHASHYLSDLLIHLLTWGMLTGLCVTASLWCLSLWQPTTPLIQHTRSLITHETQQLARHPAYTKLLTGWQTLRTHTRALTHRLMHGWQTLNAASPPPVTWPAHLSARAPLFLHVTYYMGLRSLHGILLLPVGVVVWAVALVDGQVKRSLRRLQALRESASQYQRTQRQLKITTLWWVCFTLGCPWAIATPWLVCSGFIITGVLLTRHRRWFKKYA